jgi:hypothetical protein
MSTPFEPLRRPSNPIFHFFSITLCIAKVPLFFLSLALSFIYTLIGSFIPIRAISHFVVRAASLLLFRIMLILFGVFSVPMQPTPLVDTYSEPEEMDNPSPGDIIICNCASYINLAWLSYKFSPIFILPVGDGRFLPKSFYQLLIQILGSKDLRVGRSVDLSVILQTAKDRACPIVLFPECAVTNGTGILKFADFRNSAAIPDGVKFHIFGFVHWESAVSPNFVNGNGFAHLAAMLGRFFSGLQVKVALPQDVPRVADGQIDDDFVQRARYVLGKIMGVELVELGASDFPAAPERRRGKRHND